MTSDIIDQHTDYVAILHGCLPGLAEAPDAFDLQARCRPRTAVRVVLLGSISSPPGMIDRAGFEAAR